MGHTVPATLRVFRDELRDMKSDISVKGLITVIRIPTRRSCPGLYETMSSVEVPKFSEGTRNDSLEFS